MLYRSAVGQLSFSSSRTKWQRLPAGDTLCTVSPAGNRCNFDWSNIRSSEWSGLFDRWDVEHAPGVADRPEWDVLCF